MSSSSLDLGPLCSSSKVSIEDFKLLTVVGKGSFGKVFLAQKLTGLDRGAVYAIKTLKKDVLHARGQLQHTRAEREILQAMHHPFIVSLKCAFQTPEKLYLVTDFCSGGELFFWLKRCVQDFLCCLFPRFPCGVCVCQCKVLLPSTELLPASHPPHTPSPTLPYPPLRPPTVTRCSRSPAPSCTPRSW